MNNLYQNDMLHKQKSAKKKGEKLPAGDENIEETIKKEIDAIETLEEETDYAELQKKSHPQLCEEVTKLSQELMKSHDQLLRTQAEIKNIQRRNSQDVEKAHKYGLERFTKELLPVIDSLEHALNLEPNEQTRPMHEGIELTSQMLMKVLKQFGIEEINPLNQLFDPQLHEAMTMQEDPDAKPNTVLMVLQKGYMLNNRVIRPARVIVAKRSEESS